ncbi:MAG TPA: flagellar hook-basal body protein [bacterium]|nr:flagellar hook-basal body protein [bacterium]
MIKGLYAAASAMLANLTRQGVLAHNISNLDTPGFKQILVSLDDFIEVPVISPPGPTADLRQLRQIGHLGLGVESSPEETDFTSGALKLTGQPLDLAIQGTGFFRVQTPGGERYTRDGRFTRDLEGNLVTVDGYFVLNDAGQPINLPEGSISVGVDGSIYVDGENVDQLGLASFADPANELERDLPNTFTSAGAPTGEELGTVNQGYLEMSNASPAELMTTMVAVTRAYEAAQKMVQVQDELLGKAISSLGG